jgi:hypothetical protein
MDGVMRQLRAVFGIDVRALAAFRIGLGLLVCVEVLDRGGSFVAHYTEAGVLPLEALHEHLLFQPSLLLLSDAPLLGVVVFVAAGLAGLAMAFGWHTRVATVAAFVLLFSIQARNPVINHHGDFLMRALLMWGMFLPLGAYLSLDARRKDGEGGPSIICSVASAALLLQGILLYLVVAVSKFQYDIWWRGDALYAVLHKDSYVRPLGEWLLGYPEFVAVLGWSAMLVEASLPILLFLPWKRDVARTLAVLLATGFQLSIFAVATIGTFQPLSILAIVPFLPPAFWDRLRLPASPQAAAHDDAPRGFPSMATTAVVSALLLYTIASNAVTLQREEKRLPEPLATVGYWFGLEQRWRMFANAGITPQGWHLAAGRLADGRWVDLIRGTVPANPGRPLHYSAQIRNNAWRVYWAQISRDPAAPLRPKFGAYLCRDWNGSIGPEDQVDRVEVTWFRKHAYARDEAVRYTRHVLLSQPCAAATKTRTTGALLRRSERPTALSDLFLDSTREATEPLRGSTS